MEARTAQAGHRLDEASPLGIVRFRKGSSEIVEANERVWDILGMGRDHPVLREAVARNVERLVPAARQAAFAELLAEAERGSAVEFDTRLDRSDGTPVEVACWLTAEAVREGPDDATFRLAMVDVTQKRLRARERRRAGRIGHLASQYDVVFLVEGSSRTAKCLRFAGDELFERVAGMRMALGDAAPYLAEHLSAPTDRAAVERFVAGAWRPDAYDVEATGCRKIEFEAAGGGARREAVLVSAEGGDSFLCSRPIGGASAEAPLATAGAMEREAIAIVVDEGDGQRLLYANSAARNLFALDGPGSDDASARSLLERAFSASAAAAAIRGGEVDADIAASGERCKISVDRSAIDPGLLVVRVLPLHSTRDERGPDVFVRTFGHFDVFVDGDPIPFRSEKAKELLAFLVDRRGGFVTPESAIAALWEDEPVGERARARYRKVVLRLKSTLAEHGAPGIVESVRGKHRIVPELVRCDLFDHLDGKPAEGSLFRGTYLQDYSWGEVTLSELVHDLP